MNINFRLVTSLLGYLIAFIGALMLIPAFIDYFYKESSAYTFFIFAILTFFVGVLLIFANNREKNVLVSAKDGLLLTFLSWITVVVFASLPYSFGYLKLSYPDAYFETMSGLTTTGASVIPDLTKLTYGFHFWRILMGWIGGIGIIFTGVLLIPYMQGGMSIFKVEAFETFDSALAKAKKIAYGVTMIYVIVTSAVTFALIFIANWNIFDSIIHAMSAVSTTGFSSKNLSVLEYNSLRGEIILVIGMISGSIPYVLMYYFFFLQKTYILRDQQIKGLIKIVIVTVIIISSWLTIKTGLDYWVALRYSAFSVITLITGTGLTNVDYSTWGYFPTMIFIMLMIIGSCSGSKSAGLKIYRVQVAYIFVKISIERLFFNKHVVTPFYNGKEVTNESAIGIFAYFFIYFFGVFIVAVVISFYEIDFLTALSASIACISNVGPGFGSMVSPSGNYYAMPDVVKGVLSFAMLLGRLEFFVILVIFNRKFWAN